MGAAAGKHVAGRGCVVEMGCFLALGIRPEVVGLSFLFNKAVRAYFLPTSLCV